jgi:hypothetical protein
MTKASVAVEVVCGTNEVVPGSPGLNLELGHIDEDQALLQPLTGRSPLLKGVSEARFIDLSDACVGLSQLLGDPLCFRDPDPGSTNQHPFARGVEDFLLGFGPGPDEYSRAASNPDEFSAAVGTSGSVCRQSFQDGAAGSAGAGERGFFGRSSRGDSTAALFLERRVCLADKRSVGVDDLDLSIVVTASVVNRRCFRGVQGRRPNAVISILECGRFDALHE